jgi:hypothetical protein
MRAVDFHASVERVRHGEADRIALYDSKDTDAKVRKLLCLSSLNTLVLQESDITESGLRDVARIPNLSVFYYSYAGHLGDAGLTQLCSSRSLKLLVVVQSNVSSKGIESLRNMQNLRELILYEDGPKAGGADFGHSVVAALSSLRQLELLAVGGRWMSDVQVKQLADALRGTKVVPLHSEPTDPYDVDVDGLRRYDSETKADQSTKEEKRHGPCPV